jgi:hypothetical protein
LNESAFTVLYWVPCPAGREPRWLQRNGNPTGSAWDGADAAENTAIANGTVLEIRETYSKQGTDLAGAQADLEATWTARNAWVQSFNPWNRWGSYWDDTETWTLDGVS